MDGKESKKDIDKKRIQNEREKVNEKTDEREKERKVKRERKRERSREVRSFSEPCF